MHVILAPLSTLQSKKIAPGRRQPKAIAKSLGLAEEIEHVVEDAEVFCCSPFCPGKNLCCFFAEHENHLTPWSKQFYGEIDNKRGQEQDCGTPNHRQYPDP